ncbi:MAG: hypothetical protein HN516_09730, partial [Gammaproteobacteria bacterium]|nr:hypothetical protein [Gammaproteobacteria bacterium]
MELAQDVELVLFGAAGDLSGRKLFPALLHLEACDLLEAQFNILV